MATRSRVRRTPCHKREGYWDSDLQKFDEVVFKIFPQETGLLNAIRSGQVDAGNLSDQDNIQNAKAAGIEILNPEYHLAWAGIIFYDRAGEIIPQLADSRVRRAIAHAIDGEGVLETAFLNEGTINNQIFNESSPAYETGANDTYSYDPELAKQLMAEAGYADGFKITMPSGGLLLPSIQTAVQNGLAEINIEVDWQETTGGSLYPDMAAGVSPRIRVLRIHSHRVVGGAELSAAGRDVEPLPAAAIRNCRR